MSASGACARRLALVQMEAYAARKPNQLRVGSSSRVALARALVVRPDVLLLDEPLSNLDAKLRVELRGEIRRICKTSGITTVYVTHDQKEALSMADRVAIMSAGQVAQLGTPGDLYRAPSSRFVAEFLGETNFLAAEVQGGSGTAGSAEGCVVETVAGSMRAARPAPESGPFVASIRPEALRVLGGGRWSGSLAGDVNTLRGRVVETTYLGEMAQLIVELKPGAASADATAGSGTSESGVQPRIKVAVLNPRGGRRGG